MKRNNQVVKIIFRTIRKNMFLSFLILGMVILTIVTALLPPALLGGIIDNLSLGEEVTLAAIVLYFALTAITGLAESAREGLLTVFGQRMTHALRTALMDKFHKLPADTLQGLESGTVVSRFISDVDTVENLFTSGIVSMFADACKIVSILAVIWLQNRGLSLILFVLIPFLFSFTRHVQKNMLAAQMENRKALARVSGHVPETLMNIRTIRNLNREKYMEGRYDAFIDESYEAVEKTSFYDAVYSPVILVLNAMVVAIVMVLSASGNGKVLALFGMSAGTAVAVINYISQIFAPVESLGMEIQTIQSAVAGVKRVDEFLAMEEYAVPSEDSAWRCKTGAAIVEMQNVTFGYDERDILKDFSLRVEEGEKVTILGRTGAGKSTIFKLFLGLYSPKSGRVLLGGWDAAKIPAHARRSLFGYVEQSFHMVPGSVMDQIALFDETIARSQVEHAARLVGLHETILGLEKGYDTPCSAGIFSQGQWQLLAIARAVVSNPQLLLLDEITANLDAETEKKVLLALKQVSENRTVISISHRTAGAGRKIVL